MTEHMQGSCLCGKVSYRVSGPFDTFHLCHCSQCRKSTGSAHAANIFGRADNIEWISGEDQIKRYTPEREDVISKCFCSHCGSLVPYVSLQSGRLIIPAGSLDSDISGDSVEANDIESLLTQYPDIRLIAFNGATSEKYFRRLVLPRLKVDPLPRLIRMPSTSPANAGMTLARKTDSWRVLLDYC